MASKKRKKVLLLGGSGLVGSRFLELSRDRYRIESPKRSEVDLTKIGQVEEFIHTHIPEVLIYAAGISNPDEAEEKRDLAKLLNVIIPNTISKVAKNYNVPLIYLSTDSVFKGDQSERPYNEEDSVNPVNYYGKTKYMGEIAVLQASSSNTVLRLITVYSSYFPGKLDIVRTAAQYFIKTGKFSGLIDQYANPVYVDDVVAGIQKVIKKRVGGILHIGAEKAISNFSFMELIAHKGCIENAIISPLVFKNRTARRAKRGQFTWLDTRKAKKLLGEEVISSLDWGIERFWKNYLQKTSD